MTAFEPDLGMWIVENLTFARSPLDYAEEPARMVIDQDVFLINDMGRLVVWTGPAHPYRLEQMWTYVPTSHPLLEASYRLGGEEAVRALAAPDGPPEVLNTYRRHWLKPWREFLKTGNWWDMLFPHSLQWRRLRRERFLYTYFARGETAVLDMRYPKQGFLIHGHPDQLAGDGDHLRGDMQPVPSAFIIRAFWRAMRDRSPRLWSGYQFHLEPW